MCKSFLFFYSLVIYKELENPTLIKIPFQSMIRQIDKSLKNRDNSVRGLMANEIHKHLDLCVERNEDFLGRDVDLYKVIINSRYVTYFVPLTNYFTIPC